MTNYLNVFSQVINFLIFVYFVIILVRSDALDVLGLIVSASGIMISIIVDIIGVLEE